MNASCLEYVPHSWYIFSDSSEVRLVDDRRICSISALHGKANLWINVFSNKKGKSIIYSSMFAMNLYLGEETNFTKNIEDHNIHFLFGQLFMSPLNEKRFGKHRVLPKRLFLRMNREERKK